MLHRLFGLCLALVLILGPLLATATLPASAQDGSPVAVDSDGFDPDSPTGDDADRSVRETEAVQPADGSGNTWPGSGVGPIFPLPDVYVTFGSVLTGGDTTAAELGIGDVSPLPAGFRSSNARLIEISTTATFQYNIIVCMIYTAANFDDPSTIRLLWWNGDTWSLTVVEEAPRSHRQRFAGMRAASESLRLQKSEPIQPQPTSSFPCPPKPKPRTRQRLRPTLPRAPQRKPRLLRSLPPTRHLTPRRTRPRVSDLPRDQYANRHTDGNPDQHSHGHCHNDAHVHCDRDLNVDVDSVPSDTPTSTATDTEASTSTPSMTASAAQSATLTPTDTATLTPTATATDTPTSSPTVTDSATSSATPDLSPTSTATFTATPTSATGQTQFALPNVWVIYSRDADPRVVRRVPC